MESPTLTIIVLGVIFGFPILVCLFFAEVLPFLRNEEKMDRLEKKIKDILEKILMIIIAIAVTFFFCYITFKDCTGDEYYDEYYHRPDRY